MITLTSAAAEKLQGIMGEKGLDNHALRVFVSGGGCSGLQYGMQIADEAPSTEDLVFEHAGVKVIVDNQSHQYLEGASIDFDDSLQGGGFKINNPNAVKSCGCGNSFSSGEEEGAQGGGCGSGGGGGGCGCGGH